MAPKLGLLPPQAYMASELEKLYKEYDVTQIPAEEGNWSEEHVNSLVEFCKKNEIPSVVGFAQKDAWHHALINAGLGNVTIAPHAYLVAMNKYMQRTIEEKPFWFQPIDPNAESNDEMWDKIPKEEIPFMLKNTSLSLGRGVFCIRTREDFDEIIDLYKGDEKLRAEIKETNDAIISRMDDETKASLGPVPPFLAEHRIDLSKDWVEYCYEGCITEEGELIHYAMTEEVYFEDHQSLVYVTPPMSYPAKFIPELEAYVTGYMKGLIARGYKRQFFNIELWANFSSGKPEFAFCEINPRCAHTYHYGYKYVYNTNLYGDNFNLVLDNKKPENTPWSQWLTGATGFCTEILLTAKQVGKVSEILNYEYIDELEKSGKVKLIRHVKDRNYEFTADDSKSFAGATMLQIWIVTETAAEAAKIEMDIRKNAYTSDLGWLYPTWWQALILED